MHAHVMFALLMQHPQVKVLLTLYVCAGLHLIDCFTCDAKRPVHLLLLIRRESLASAELAQVRSRHMLEN